MACVNSSLEGDPTSCSFFHSLSSPPFLTVPFFWSSKSIEIFCALKHPSTHDQRKDEGGERERRVKTTEKEDSAGASHTCRICRERQRLEGEE